MLPTQLFVSDKLPTKELMKPVQKQNRLLIKGDGGLWTSCYLGEKLGSDWIQWCLSESFRLPQGNVFHGYLMEVNPKANIFVVDTLEDMHYVFDKYGYPFIPEAPINMEAIDFQKMAEDYDGMHLTSRGQAVTRHGFDFFARQQANSILDENKKMRNLYGWDCQSTHHFRWNFTSVKPITIKAVSEYEAG